MTERHYLNPGRSRHASELAQLEQVFGENAEMISRGLAVATADLPAADALTLVLRLLSARDAGTPPLTELERCVARALWPEDRRGWEELGEGPLARLLIDVRTSLGVFYADTQVRVLDRLPDGRLLIGVLDINQTTFPVAEAALEPFHQVEDAS